MKRWLAIGLALFGLLLAVAQAAQRPLILYAYHLKPPFIVDVAARRGLYYDFADYANRKLGRLQFRTEYQPRRRLEVRVRAEGFDQAVIGVVPLWFRDVEQTRYFWSGPWLEDRDEVISLALAPVEYARPDTLLGKRIGLPAGYYYYGVDELVKAGKIVREDADSEEQNLHKLLARRIDATIVSRSTLRYLLAKRTLPPRFHVAATAHDAFDRRILVSRKRPEAMAALRQAMAGMHDDPEWQAVLARYQ